MLELFIKKKKNVMLKLAKNNFILFYFFKSGSFRKTALTAQ